MPHREVQQRMRPSQTTHSRCLNKTANCFILFQMHSPRGFGESCSLHLIHVLSSGSFNFYLKVNSKILCCHSSTTHLGVLLNKADCQYNQRNLKWKFQSKHPVGRHCKCFYSSSCCVRLMNKVVELTTWTFNIVQKTQRSLGYWNVAEPHHVLELK